uniref:Uncharacterized protein n=1 Tax=Hucho hucho TaxID=62062 RepID=A0A4W5JCK2_9TELE
MHLTNYAIKKHSENFVRDDDTGSKSSLLPIKTLVSAHPILKHNYHTCFPNHAAGSACFEILDFDVLLDHQQALGARSDALFLGEPLPPSFPTDLWFDREEKNGLLYDSLVLINLAACDRHKFAEEDKRRVKERLQQNWSREARCSWNNVMDIEYEPNRPTPRGPEEDQQCPVYSMDNAV